MCRKILFLLLLFYGALLMAQQKQVVVKYINTPITIDASLDESPWDTAIPATNFWEYFPTDTIQAKHQTEIRMLFDDQNLYVGIKVNAIGNDYVVPSLRRDFRAGGSDNVTLMFDTFADGNNAFLFGSNPEGVRREALVSGGGKELRGFTTSWDTKWEGTSKQYDGYYITEWAIPLSAFKYRAGETRWRFNCYQFDTQGNERNTWINIPQNQFIFNLAYMGDMIFEKPLGSPRSPISIIPYINAFAGKDYQEDEDLSDFGVGGDARLTIGNSLNLDLTLNPDFSQVEVDQQVTNLTRFEINLPERRQFFIENSDLFADFGNAQDANPFFSRRIGIAKDTSDTTIQNDIIAGVRLSGKLNNNFRVGLLSVQTTADKDNEIGANNNTVLALQHKLFSRSNISFLFVNRQNTGDEDFISSAESYNRVVGLDYNLASADNTWFGKFYAHKSFTPEVSQDDYSAGASLQYNSNSWRIRGSGLIIGENFNSDLGFIRRKDILKIDPRIDRLLFPKNGVINRHTFSFSPEFIWRPNLDMQNTDYNLQTSWNAELKNTSNFSVRMFNRYVFLFDGFDPSRSDGTPLPANSDYRWTSFQLQYRSDQRKVLSYEISPTAGQFFNGELYGLRGNVNLRLQPHFNLALQARYDYISLPKPFATANLWLLGPRIDVTFNKSVFWATFIQYSSQSDNFSINSRLQWRFAPLSDLFLVYNDNYFTDTVFAPRVRSINLKLTYWLYL
ncbi:MAG: hydrolase [Cytophagaceae bacterium]|nr:hydrolase [Cytophagaceae bacterium]